MAAKMQALIFGDGPAARLAAIALTNAGAQVVRALPRSGLGPPPTARHSHIVPDDLHISAAAIDAALAQDLAARAEPGFRWRFNNGTEWQDYIAPRTSRQIVDACLAKRLSQMSFETWRDVALVGKDGARLIAQSGDKQRVFDLTIDATGNHHATRPMLAALGHETRLQQVGKPTLYQTFELEFDAPAKDRIHWSSAPVDGPLGALYGHISGRHMRITGSIGRAAQGAVRTADDFALVFGDRIAALVPKGARITRKTATVLPQFRRLRHQQDSAPNWIALGDARVQWAPRLGTGLSSIFRQCRILFEALQQGGGVPDARDKLDAHLDKLWDQNLEAMSTIEKNAARTTAKAAAPGAC